MSKRRFRAYLLLITVAAIWGAAGPVIKFTLSGIEPFPFLAYRFIISAVVSIIFFSIKGVRIPKPKKTLPPVILYGLLAFTIALGMLFSGLEKSTALDLTVISTIAPLIVVAGGAIIYKDRVTHREKIGIAIVLLGALISSFIPFIGNGGGARLTGNLFIFAFLFADTSSYLLAKKIVRMKVPSITLTNIGFIVGAVTIVPLALATSDIQSFVGSIANMPLKYHLGVWYMALVSGSLAYFLVIKGQKSIEVSEAALFAYLQPIFSVPLAVFWLGEKVTPSFVLGMTIITAGIIIAEYKKASKH